MEPLFENNYTRDRRVFTEFYVLSFFRLPVYIVLDCIVLLYLISTLGRAVTADSSEYLGNLIAAVLSLGIYVAIRLLVFFRSRSAAVKRDREMNLGTEMQIRAAFTETHLSYELSNGTRIELPYTDVKRIRQTKHLICLQSKTRTVYIVKKDAFTKGDNMSFLAFLKQKGFRV